MIRSLRFPALLALSLAASVSAQDKEAFKNPPLTTPAAPGAAAPAAVDEAAAAGAVARRFYDDYVQRFLRGKGKKPALAAWVAARPEVSAQFKRVFAAADAKAKRSEMGGWEADPIINAQDFPDDGGMVVKAARVNGSTATVTMNWARGMDAPVEVTLLRFPEGWKIHGIGALVAK